MSHEALGAPAPARHLRRGRYRTERAHGTRGSGSRESVNVAASAHDTWTRSRADGGIDKRPVAGLCSGRRLRRGRHGVCTPPITGGRTGGVRLRRRGLRFWTPSWAAVRTLGEEPDGVGATCGAVIGERAGGRAVLRRNGPRTAVPGVRRVLEPGPDQEFLRAGRRRLHRVERRGGVAGDACRVQRPEHGVTVATSWRRSGARDLLPRIAVRVPTSASGAVCADVSTATRVEGEPAGR